MFVKSKTIVAFCLFLAIVAASSVSSHPVDSSSDEVNSVDLELSIEGFEPIPLRIQRREKRQIYGGVTNGQPGGVQGTLGASGTLYNNGGHRVDGHGQVSKNWGPTGPTTVGGGLDYTGPRGGASINAQHQHGLGTSVGAEGRYNMYSSPNGQTTIDAHGGYGRHFGGPYGTSKPDYNVGIGLNHRF